MNQYAKRDAHKEAFMNTNGTLAPSYDLVRRAFDAGWASHKAVIYQQLLGLLPPERHAASGLIPTPAPVNARPMKIVIARTGPEVCPGGDRPLHYVRTEIDSGGMTVSLVDVNLADEFPSRVDAIAFALRVKERYPAETDLNVVEVPR